MFRQFALHRISESQAEYIVELPKGGALVFTFSVKDREWLFELEINDSPEHPVRQLDLSSMPLLALEVFTMRTFISSTVGSSSRISFRFPSSLSRTESCWKSNGS